MRLAVIGNEDTIVSDDYMAKVIEGCCQLRPSVLYTSGARGIENCAWSTAVFQWKLKHAIIIDDPETLAKAVEMFLFVWGGNEDAHVQRYRAWAYQSLKPCVEWLCPPGNYFMAD